ncbi:MAG: hypothetical protein ACPLSK_01320 [bacterium]
MTDELKGLIKVFAIGTAEDLQSYIGCKPITVVAMMLQELLHLYLNDKNSSTLREFITVSLAGYEPHPGKIGYNGYKQEQGGKTKRCEAKPKNVDTRSFPLRKLNGGGNFTDYTFNRLERDKEENPSMLVSGFVDGHLVYIIEFPFACPTFLKKIENQLKEWEKKLTEGRETKGQFLRSAYFTYKDYINCPDLRIVYLAPRAQLEKFKNYIVPNFYQFLLAKSGEREG